MSRVSSVLLAVMAVALIASARAGFVLRQDGQATAAPTTTPAQPGQRGGSGTGQGPAPTSAPAGATAPVNPTRAPVPATAAASTAAASTAAASTAAASTAAASTAAAAPAPTAMPVAVAPRPTSAPSSMAPPQATSGPSATSAPMGTAGPSATSAPQASTAPVESAAPSVTPEPSATILPKKPRNVTNTTDDGSVCFPGSATIELESGAIRRMDEITAGDRVKIASGQFSEVFMFTHKLASSTHNFVSVKTAAGNSLSLTGGHYIYVNGALVPAKSVTVGDELQLGSGSTTTVTSVSCVVDTGLYNPQTLHGDIVVNGIRASTYTTAVEPRLAHAGLSVVRALYRAMGLTVTAFDSGADSLASVLPSGVAAY